MHARRYLAVVLLLAAFACSGGSGSSGFDSLTEDAAIAQALSEHRCVARQGLNICPADTRLDNTPPAAATSTPTMKSPERTPPGQVPTATPTPTTTGVATRPPTATPTPTATPLMTQAPGPDIRIDTGLTDGSSLPCIPDEGGAACRFTLPFAASGFAPTVQFRVAVRLADGRAWMIGPDLVPLGSPAMPSFDAPVDVQAGPAGPTQSLAAQVAVLVFLTPRSEVPGQVEELADSGADYAFVSGEFALVPLATGS